MTPNWIKPDRDINGNKLPPKPDLSVIPKRMVKIIPRKLKHSSFKYRTQTGSRSRCFSCGEPMYRSGICQYCVSSGMVNKNKSQQSKIDQGVLDVSDMITSQILPNAYGELFPLDMLRFEF